ncbi:hypothetical protein RCL1_001871 [Eukaryota sp. TZLM3-RCL]
MTFTFLEVGPSLVLPIHYEVVNKKTWWNSAAEHEFTTFLPTILSSFRSNLEGFTTSTSRFSSTTTPIASKIHRSSCLKCECTLEPFYVPSMFNLSSFCQEVQCLNIKLFILISPLAAK